MGVSLLRYKVSAVHIGLGSDKSETRFTVAKLNHKELTTLFTKPDESDKVKNGLCFNAGIPKETEEGRYRRLKTNIASMSCIVYDIDYCDDVDIILKKIRKSWKFYWLAHTSYTHMATSSDLSVRVIKGETKKDLKKSIKAFFKDKGLALTSVSKIRKKKNRVLFDHSPVSKMRIIIPLATPYKLKGLKDETWSALYFSPADTAGIGKYLDKSGLDVNRFFYTPRVPEGKEKLFRSAKSKHKGYYSNVITFSDDDDIDALKSKGFDLISWVKNLDTFDIEGFVLKEAGSSVLDERTDGGLFVTCPHADYHTSTSPTDTFVKNTEEGYIFHCSHDSCSSAGRLGRTAKMILDHDVDKKVVKKYGVGSQNENTNTLLSQIAKKVSNDDKYKDRVSKVSKKQDKKVMKRLTKVAKHSHNKKATLDDMVSKMVASGTELSSKALATILSVSSYGKDELIYILKMMGIDPLKRRVLLKDVFNLRSSKDEEEIKRMLAAIDDNSPNTAMRNTEIQRLADYFGKTKRSLMRWMQQIIDGDLDENGLSNFYKMMDTNFAIYLPKDGVKIALNTKFSIPPLNDFLKMNTRFSTDAVSPPFVTDSNMRYEVKNSHDSEGAGMAEKFKDNIGAWSKTDTNKILINTITFNPDETNTVYQERNGYHVYNLWQGYKTPIPKTKIKLEKYEDLFADEKMAIFMNHILAHCADDVKVFKWLILWYASLIQRPEVRYPTAVIVKGVQGTGKSLIPDAFLSKLTYPYYISFRDIDEVTESSGTLAQGRILVTLDDATFAGSPAQQKKLKSFISAKSVEVNEKYIKKYTVPMYARLYLTTNDTHVANVEAGDRRYLILEANTAWERQFAKNPDYFRPLVALSEDVDFMGKLHFILSAVKPEMLGLTWGSLQTAPMTSAKERQFEASMSLMQRAVYDIITTGVINKADGSVDLWRLNEPLELEWYGFENSIKGYVEAKDRHNYNKETVLEALTIMGAEGLHPTFAAGKVVNKSKTTRREYIEIMHGFGLLSDDKCAEFLAAGDSAIESAETTKAGSISSGGGSGLYFGLKSK